MAAGKIDESLHWTDHFVEYGFAVLRGQVSREYAAAALERVRAHVQGPGKDLPFDQWTTKNVKLTSGPKVDDPVLNAVYDQPGIREIMFTMFGTDVVGSPTGWSGKLDYQIFLNPFNPDGKPRRLWGGHIDFGGNIIPLFGNAFVMQVALHETEPNGGNITVVPGSHKLVQQRTIENPTTQYPYDFADFPFTEPYEFVAQPGDVFLMHHLMFHSGNPCVGATRKPRIALHCQAHRSTFLTKADPAEANAPWVRSFTLNGYVEDPNDERRYIDFCEAKKAMWGFWASDDGRTQYKIYTYSDGALRAKIKLPDGSEQISRGARFDGRQLTFEQDFAAEANESASEGGTATRVQPRPHRAVAQLDSSDAERLRVTLTPNAAGGPTTLNLRRTEKITGRVHD